MPIPESSLAGQLRLTTMNRLPAPVTFREHLLNIGRALSQVRPMLMPASFGVCSDYQFVVGSGSPYNRNQGRWRTVLTRLKCGRRCALWFSSLAAVACHSDGGSVQTAETVLAPVGIVGDSGTLVLPTAMKVLGDRLLVASARDSFALTVIDLKTGRIAARAAPLGDTTGALRVAWFLFEESHDPPRAWIFDVMNRQMTLWDVRGMPKEIRRFRPRLRMASSARPLLTPSGMVVDALFRGATIEIGDPMNDSAEALVGRPPFVRSEFPKNPDAHITANDLFPVANPSRTRLALLYKHVTRVDIFDIGTRQITTAFGPGQVPRPRQGSKLAWAELPDTHVNGQDATARYIYSVYCGCTAGQRRRGTRGTIVRIFDWNGRFMRDLHLDRHVTAIAVSPNDSVLYGAMQDPLPMVGLWLLPSSLRD